MQEAVEWPCIRAALSWVIPCLKDINADHQVQVKHFFHKDNCTQNQTNFIGVSPELLSKWVGESDEHKGNIQGRQRQNFTCVVFLLSVDSINTREEWVE